MNAGGSGRGLAGPPARLYEQRYYTPQDIGCFQLFVPNSAGPINTNVNFFLEGQVDVTVQAREDFGGDGAGGLVLYVLCGDPNDTMPVIGDAVQVLPQGSFCLPLAWGANTFTLERAACGVVRRVQFVFTNDFPAADDALVTMKLLTRARATTPGVRIAA